MSWSRVARRMAHGKHPIEIQDGNWDHYSPAIVAMPDGVMVLWSGQSNGNYDLFGATVSNDGTVSKPERLTTAPFSDFNARAASDAAGNVTVVWQSFRNLNADIYARRFSQRWGTGDPDLKRRCGRLGSRSRARPHGNCLDLLGWLQDRQLRCISPLLRRKKLGDVIAMTTEPTAQFH